MDLKLPKLGEGAESGTVVNVLVRVGDMLREGQPILELENEKAVAPIPASSSGVIAHVRVKEGDRVSVGQVLITLVAPSAAEAASAAAPAPAPSAPLAPPAARTTAAVPAPGPALAPASTPSAPPVARAATPPLPPGVPLAAAPNIRYLARELGIELSAIQGSGRGGRIELMDLRHHIDALRAAAAGAVAVAPTAGPAPPPTAAAAAAPSAAAVMVDFARWGPVRRQPLTALRRTISQRMRESWSAVPRVTQFDQADVTGVLALRAAQAQAYEAKGARLTVTGFVLKAVAAALRKHPVLNASLDEAAGELVLKEYIHLGLAVDTGAGLLVPVIRDADKKSLFELSRELADLARRARERKLALEEMRGGTFTISNQGGIGSGAFTPIINLPEVAILGLGRSVAQAVVRDGQIVARTLLPLAVSYDHRVIDGGTAARFTVDLVRALEQFPAAQAAL